MDIGDHQHGLNKNLCGESMVKRRINGGFKKFCHCDWVEFLELSTILKGMFSACLSKNQMTQVLTNSKSKLSNPQQQNLWLKSDDKMPNLSYVVIQNYELICVQV